ncbi:MAG: hypothetical protein WAX14_19220 [Rhodococcus sp. (in: high G+C Gram-positive bacteria)]|uniref:hypothetical protein n=1 Tax=Rhodococcus sp. TaxID=1831 RepID=UPI003BB5CFED
MPRTLDSIIDCHRAAEQRRKAGLPIWEHTVDVSATFGNDDLTFERRRTAIAAALRASRWYASCDEWSFLHEIVENIADAEDPDMFDSWWDELYDLADTDRVWIRTR